MWGQGGEEAWSGNNLHSPYDVIVIYKCADVLKLVGHMEGVLFPPEVVKCLKGCSSPGA